MLLDSPQARIKSTPNQQKSTQPIKTLIQLPPGVFLGSEKLHSVVCDPFTPGALKNIICLGKTALSVYAANQNRIWFVKCIRIGNPENSAVLNWIEAPLPKKIVVVPKSILLIAPKLSQITSISLNLGNPNNVEKKELNNNHSIIDDLATGFEIHGPIKNSAAVYSSITNDNLFITLCSLSKRGQSFIMRIPTGMEILDKIGDQIFSEQKKQRKKILKKFSIVTNRRLLGNPKLISFDQNKNALKLIIRKESSKIAFIVIDAKNRKILQRKVITIFDILGEKISTIAPGSSPWYHQLFSLKTFPMSRIEIQTAEYCSKNQCLVGTIELTHGQFGRLNFLFSMSDITGRCISKISQLNETFKKETLSSRCYYHENLSSMVYSKVIEKGELKYSLMMAVDPFTLEQTKLMNVNSEQYDLSSRVMVPRQCHDLGGHRMLVLGLNSIMILDNTKKSLILRFHHQVKINPKSYECDFDEHLIAWVSKKSLYFSRIKPVNRWKSTTTLSEIKSIYIGHEISKLGKYKKLSIRLNLIKEEGAYSVYLLNPEARITSFSETINLPPFLIRIRIDSQSLESLDIKSIHLDRCIIDRKNHTPIYRTRGVLVFCTRLTQENEFCHQEHGYIMNLFDRDHLVKCDSVEIKGHLRRDEYPIVCVSNGNVIVKEHGYLLNLYSIDVEKMKFRLKKVFKLFNMDLEPHYKFKIPCGDEENFLCLNATYPEIGSPLLLKFNRELELVGKMLVNDIQDGTGFTLLKNGEILFESSQLAKKLRIEANVEKRREWKTRMNHMFGVSFEEKRVEYVGSFEQTFGLSAREYVGKCFYSVEDEKDVLVRYQFQ